MNNGKHYNTRQRETVFQCIKAQKGEYVTIKQIARYLEGENIKVGLTTIYRTIDKLISEGKIASVSIEGIKGKCYRYIAENDESDSFPLKCEECGRVVKIQCPELEHLYEHLREEHKVQIASEKIMFYGICDKCK
ncbi:MAG: transcriptional repressor [Hornefia sp.]|nr:transcriptional repressor [Hornefia sp.]